jgi:hypothetical protein
MSTKAQSFLWLSPFKDRSVNDICVNLPPASFDTRCELIVGIVNRGFGINGIGQWYNISLPALKIEHILKEKSKFKFCGLLISHKENICISLVLVAHF